MHIFAPEGAGQIKWGEALPIHRPHICAGLEQTHRRANLIAFFPGATGSKSMDGPK
jgi:hypothetical protein